MSMAAGFTVDFDNGSAALRHLATDVGPGTLRCRARRLAVVARQLQPLVLPQPSHT